MEKVLHQILDELKTVNGRLDRLEDGQAELRQGQQEQGRRLTKLALHVEGEITDKIRGLYDSREVLNDTLTRINRQLDECEGRQDLHSYPSDWYGDRRLSL